MIPSNIKGVLFDLDGVLIDSEGTYTLFWAEMDRRYPTGIENFATFIKGTTLPEILTRFPDPQIQHDITVALHEFQANMQFRPFPDTIELLKRLKARGIKMAIVTSSDSAKMERLWKQLPELRPYFDVIIDAGQVTKSKPDPQGYLKGCDALGLQPAECLVFEDSLQGLRAGRASGAGVVGVATTYPHEVICPYADRVISHLSDLF